LSKHPKLFKDDTYKFEASNELMMCMPFDFIDGFKDKKWTHIDKKWLSRLMKHLKKVQSSNINQIRFIRHIGRLDIYDNSREYNIEDDCHIYEIFLENDITHCVNFCQINVVIGDEEWLQGEVNCLCNIASSWIIYLSWGAKKKESTHSDALCVCEGDHVSVENHGNTGFILDILSALTKTQKQLLWSGKRHWKTTLFTYVIAKSTTNCTSFQGNINL
jgi:hypothetical protein